jgi:hypothetical protein
LSEPREDGARSDTSPLDTLLRCLDLDALDQDL